MANKYLYDEPSATTGTGLSIDGGTDLPIIAAQHCVSTATAKLHPMVSDTGAASATQEVQL